jgi:hypothetical protein
MSIREHQVKYLNGSESFSSTRTYLHATRRLSSAERSLDHGIFKRPILGQVYSLRNMKSPAASGSKVIDSTENVQGH